MIEETPEYDSTQARLSFGEAWMWCNECGAKLYSFDGNEDADRKCPTKELCEKDSKQRKFYHGLYR